MKYMLMIYESGDEVMAGLSDAERNGVYDEYAAISQAPGVTGGDQLQPTATATTVRVSGGETMTTDGPYAETKEQLGGYYLVEAGDPAAALKIAASIPAAWLGGAVEVRPVMER